MDRNGAAGRGLVRRVEAGQAWPGGLGLVCVARRGKDGRQGEMSHGREGYGLLRYGLKRQAWRGSDRQVAVR